MWGGNTPCKHLKATEDRGCACPDCFCLSEQLDNHSGAVSMTGGVLNGSQEASWELAAARRPQSNTQDLHVCQVLERLCSSSHCASDQLLLAT